MISVANLLKNKPLPGNYFAFDAYVRGDFEAGLIENRRGDRLLALPQTLMQAIYASLEKETGTATGAVLFSCGRWWGKNFYARFAEEVSGYYGKNLAEMEMVELLQCLKQCWKTHGWGTFDLDMSYYEQGFLVVQVWNSPFAAVAPQGTQPACFMEAGVLSAFFSQLTGRQLHCLQTSCESLGADCNRFILGLPHRLKPAETWLQSEPDHQTVMERLCRSEVL